MLIAVPTGVKIFNWIATLWGGSIRFTTAMLFATAFLIEFTIGGLSGVAFAVVPIDWQTTDTYFVVAHLHYVLFGGTVFALFAGAYYWFPKMTGRLLSERIGKWHFWLTVAGFNLTFLIQHWLGLIGRCPLAAPGLLHDAHGRHRIQPFARRAVVHTFVGGRQAVFGEVEEVL